MGGGGVGRVAGNRRPVADTVRAPPARARALPASALAPLLAACAAAPGSAMDQDFKRAACEFVAAADATAFDGLPDEAAAALLSLGRLGAHPRALVDVLLSRGLGLGAGARDAWGKGPVERRGSSGSEDGLNNNACGGGGGSCEEENASPGGAAGGSPCGALNDAAGAEPDGARGAALLSARQAHMAAAALAMLRTPRECEAPLRELLRALEARVAPQGACGGGGEVGGWHACGGE